jgi:hypothetical protein
MTDPNAPKLPDDMSARPREGSWAKPVERLSSAQVQADINLNVEGKKLAGPLRGFGQMWQKTYKIRLNGIHVTPVQLVKEWKEKFGSFWAKKNRIYTQSAAIQAGEVAVLNLAGPYGIMAPGGKGLVSTGVLVIYEDEESFSFMTPEGHIFAGMITFSAFEEDGVWAQIQVLVRANDPLYELGARIGLIHKMEDEHWHTVLSNLAGHFGAQGKVEQTDVLVDPRLMWSESGNIRHNAAIHTGIYLAMSPFRWLGSFLRRNS